jgi:hypothetical protein
MRCLQENGVPSMHFVSLDLNNDGSYDIECPQNHKTRVILQNQKFEILFEIGSLAFLDGYNFEAVASFTASLERFLEFCIKILYLTKNNELTDFEKLWKHVENQSERQYGAFLFLYFNEFQKIEDVPEKWKAFRNKVLHKGYLPSTEETFLYGQFVYDFITQLIQKFQYDKTEIIQKFVFFDLNNKGNSLMQSSTMFLSTMLNYASKKDLLMTFKASLGELKKRQRWWK